jgi:ribosome-binding protein aMBF1 (putative translation factor)
MKIAGIELTPEQVQEIISAKEAGQRRISITPTPEQSAAWRVTAERERAELEGLPGEVARRQPSVYATAIRDHRQAQGISLAELAKRTGMTRAALSRIENGLNVNPTVQTLRRIGEALGLRLIVDFAA